jgi:quinoprotein dehydrogenase-associated probable ABC transporter substrate-binding protein
VRNTLGAHRCDVIPGFPQGDELVQSTNPYYRSAYALVVRPGTGLDDIDTLTDPRLRDRRIGIVAGTPPATYLAVNALLPNAKSYPLVVDTRVDSSARAMMQDLASGEIDLGILWGPLAGYYARLANPPARIKLLLKETGGPPLAFRIAMGVRATDQNWKRQLNRLIAENRADINRLLLGFGVPLLDEKDRPITDDTPAR